MSTFDPSQHPRGNQATGHAGQFADKAQSGAEVGLERQQLSPVAAAETHLNETIIAPLLTQLDMPADACRGRLTSTRTETAAGAQQRLSIALDWKEPATDADTMAEQMIFTGMLKRLIEQPTT